MNLGTNEDGGPPDEFEPTGVPKQSRILEECVWYLETGRKWDKEFWLHIRSKMKNFKVELRKWKAELMSFPCVQRGLDSLQQASVTEDKGEQSG